MGLKGPSRSYFCPFPFCTAMLSIVLSGCLLFGIVSTVYRRSPRSDHKARCASASGRPYPIRKADELAQEQKAEPSETAGLTKEPEAEPSETTQVFVDTGPIRVLMRLWVASAFIRSCWREVATAYIRIVYIVRIHVYRELVLEYG